MNYSKDTQVLVDAMTEGRMTLLELLAHVQHLESLGEHRAAANIYALWINHAKAGEKHFALFNCAGLLQNLQRTDEAVLAYETCISTKPEFAQAYVNLGLLHEKLGQETLALQTWLRLINRRYLEQPPSDEFLTMALNHIGRLQESLKNYDQAEEALEQSLRINPMQPGVIQHWVHIRQKACKWPVYKPIEGVDVADMRRYTSPLAMLALSDDPAEQLQAAQSFVTRTYPLKEERLFGSYSHQRLRIGYVSADFREHAVGFLLPAMLAGHDKSEFELYAYDFSKDEQTTVRAQIRSHFDHFRSIKDLTDRAAAELIRSDEIDVLIDLHGLSAGARPGIFALHPAPKQGTYLGFIGSTGMPWLDFVLTDSVALPEELRPYFTEKPLYLEGSFLPKVSYAAKDGQASRAQVGIPEHAFVMGALGNTYKITPEIFDVWMRLLKQIPEAVICLIDDSKAGTASLKEQAQLRGVSEDRLIFLPRTAHPVFCAHLKLLDVYLDTYPYNCGSTTNDVIHAGVPLVTLYGKTMVSRMGLSVLTSLGRQATAASSYTEYEEKVMEVFASRQRGDRKPVFPSAQPLPIGESLKSLTSVKSLPAEKKPPVAHVVPEVRLFQICYSNEHVDSVPSGFSVLNNSESARKDWRELWPIRNYLLTHELDDDVFYGFFDPDFAFKTNLRSEDVEDYVRWHGAANDVLIFSPFWDYTSFFGNPFLQGEYFHAGLLDISQKFADSVGFKKTISECLMHSKNTVYCNYFVARKEFWLKWLDLADKIFFAAEQDTSEMYSMLNKMVFPGRSLVQYKVLVQERLANLLLMAGPFRSRSWRPFDLPASNTPLNAYATEAFYADSLKMAYCQYGEENYRNAYLKLCKETFARCGMASPNHSC